MRDRIDRIEALIHEEVGRSATALFAAARGGLWAAASALTEQPPSHVGILTGFFIPGAQPPAAETDGPAGAALLALAFSQLGVPSRILTDSVCRGACMAALRGAGVDAPVDAVSVDQPLQPSIALWRGLGIDWAIAIERCGISRDGRPRNMRGEDVGAWTAPLDRVFTAGPWRTIAIGDGGNEVGMGALPAGLVAGTMPMGDVIASVTPAEFLIAAGVSHWGAYALIGALATRGPRWAEMLSACFDPATDQSIVGTLVRDGPAVDGVTREPTVTIDGIDMATHRRKLEQVRALASSG